MSDIFKYTNAGSYTYKQWSHVLFKYDVENNTLHLDAEKLNKVKFYIGREKARKYVFSKNGSYAQTAFYAKGTFGSVYFLQDAYGEEIPLVLKLFSQRMNEEHQKKISEAIQNWYETEEPVSKYFLHYIYLDDGCNDFSTPVRLAPIALMERSGGVNNVPTILDANYLSGDDGKRTICKIVVEFLQMMRSLDSAHIGFGDLSGDNIVVEENEGRISLKLIDYDDVFVEGITGNSSQCGKAGYQHWSRISGDTVTPLNEKIHYFSSILFYLTLKLLACYYDSFVSILEERVDQDEQYLLFSPAELERPSIKQGVFRQLLEVWIEHRIIGGKNGDNFNIESIVNHLTKTGTDKSKVFREILGTFGISDVPNPDTEEIALLADTLYYWASQDSVEVQYSEYVATIPSLPTLLDRKLPVVRIPRTPDSGTTSGEQNRGVPKGEYTIKYVGNGGHKVRGPVLHEKQNIGEYFVTRENPFEREGYIFKGWSRKTKGPAEFDALTQIPSLTDKNGDTVNLYAVWEKKHEPKTVSTTYTVNFDGNGATEGKMLPAEYTVGISHKLRSNHFSRPGYKFTGWAKSPSGPIIYENEALVSNLVTIGDSITLYAQWKPIQYKVNYQPNGADNMSETFSSTHTYSKPTPLAKNTYHRKGYKFLGWSKIRDGPVVFTDGQLLTEDLRDKEYDVSLFAVWEKTRPTTYTLRYNSNGGSGAMKSETIEYGSPHTLAKNKFTRNGYQFKGWATTKSGSEVYIDSAWTANPNSENNEIVTLYAVWEKIQKPIPSPKPQRVTKRKTRIPIAELSMAMIIVCTSLVVLLLPGENMIKGILSGLVAVLCMGLYYIIQDNSDEYICKHYLINGNYEEYLRCSSTGLDYLKTLLILIGIWGCIISFMFIIPVSSILLFWIGVAISILVVIIRVLWHKIGKNWDELE